MTTPQTTGQTYSTEVPVRWSDMDAFGHINHARMVTLLEEARIPFLLDDDKPTKRQRDGLVVVDLTVKYKAQLRHADSPFTVTMWLTGIRACDYTVNYEVRGRAAALSDKPAVTATTRLATFDMDEQRPRRMNDTERQFLRQYVREHG